MTVSNALANTRSVAPETRAKVLRIAKELNYVPNSAARALATGRTGLIAILSGPMNEPYYANMVHFVETHLNADGYKLVLMRTPKEVKELIHATGNTTVDGVIAIDMHGLVEEFRVHSAIPCVAIGTFFRSFVDCITVDLSTGVEAALEHMLAAGRQSIAYLATVHYMASDEEIRARTYLATMQNAGQKPRIINVNTGVLDEVGPRFKANIKKNGCPDALLCQNDETAMCAYRVLRDLGFRVPEDVLLVGCDGQLHMKYFEPPLSTIVQPMDEMCATAWQFLKNRMADPKLPLQHVGLQSRLLVRESLALLECTFLILGGRRRSTPGESNANIASFPRVSPHGVDARQVVECATISFALLQTPRETKKRCAYGAGPYGDAPQKLTPLSFHPVPNLFQRWYCAPCGFMNRADQHPPSSGQICVHLRLKRKHPRFYQLRLSHSPSCPLKQFVAIPRKHTCIPHPEPEAERWGQGGVRLYHELYDEWFAPHDGHYIRPTAQR